MNKPQKIVTISLLILAIVGITYSFNKIQIEYYFKKKSSIFWSVNAEINIEDFKGDIDWNSKSTEWWYHELYLRSTNLKDAEVIALFNKKQSWIKDTTDFKEVMRVQKLKFNLYESYARKCNREMNKIKHRDDKFYSDLEKILQKNFKELLITEDSIHNSGLSRDETIKYWDEKIQKRLNKNK
jgi:hypothetical protein|tara:strand:+ start:1074 stop:1622 length:549 start_codon:yes stop_codon:yes gene_type:complete